MAVLAIHRPVALRMTTFETAIQHVHERFGSAVAVSARLPPPRARRIFEHESVRRAARSSSHGSSSSGCRGDSAIKESAVPDEFKGRIGRTPPLQRRRTRLMTDREASLRSPWEVPTMPIPRAAAAVLTVSVTTMHASLR